MNICLISNLYPPAILGGAEIIVEKMAEKISLKDDVKLIVITTSPDSDYHIVNKETYKIYQINTTKLYPPYQQTKVNGIKKPLWHLFDLWNNKTLNEIKKILIEENIDIVHINNYKGLSLSCFKAPKDLNIPVIFESHDFSLICPRANLIRANNTLCNNRNFICNQYVNIQRKLLNENVDLLICPSNFMINKFKENNFFKNTKSVKIPLGVENKTIKSNKTYDNIDITYIGSLGKHKGVHTLINAFKSLENDAIKLHIIGKGYDEKEFIEMSNDDSRIIFHGFVDNSEIYPYYEMSNIVVIPSICYDNSPLVIYESFNSGTPVVGSNIGGIPELIKDGENGFLFEAENSDDLKEKLEEIINNKSLLKKLEDNAYNTFSSESMNIMIDNILKEYNKLLE